MNRTVTSLFIFICYVLFSNTLLAQQPIQVNLQGSVTRAPISVPKGESTLQINGLENGKRYTLVAVGAAAGQKAGFTLRMKEKSIEKAALLLSRPNRPESRTFVATEKSVQVIVTASTLEATEQIPMFMSVVCEDCGGSSAWENEFLQQVESMANMTVTPGGSATDLITNVLIGGSCFDLANITSAGNNNSRGTFNNGATSINIQEGVVLASGHVNILPGPNDQQNANNGFNNNSADDTDLATIIAGNQWDLSKIEFDFTPTSSTVQFEFVFGSEEYCEFVNTQFNDVFGFFISGPGITGVQNLAIVPGGGSDPITINSVNHLTNTAYYVNNNTWNPCQNLSAFAINDCELDGWTTVLTATAEVIPCSTYHIKLAIADIADQAYASAVFLKANSFDAGGAVKASPVYPSGQTFVYEGCDGGFIRFTRVGDDSQPLIVNYTIGGGSSATPGEDYEPLSGTVTIPAGQSTIDIPVDVFSDLIIEGQETIIIMLDNPCSCNQTQTTFIIEDKPPLETELEDQTICGGTSATLSPDVSGGFPPLTYLWSTGATGSSLTVNAQGTNTYTVTVTDDCGTTSTAEATVTIEPAPTANLTGSGFFCAGQTGTVNLTLTLTGLAPWEVTYDANGTQVTETFTSTPATIVATEPGPYTLVSVSSPNGCTGTVTGNVNIQEYDVEISLNANDPPCFGNANGTITTSPSGGSSPYTYAWNTGATSQNLSGLAPGSYTVTVSDSHGCTEENTVDLTEPPQLTASISSSSNIDCNNPQGEADLEVSGGTPGYSFNWSNGSSSEDPVFNNGGTFTVTVTDDNNCTTTASVSITSNTLQPTANLSGSGYFCAGQGGSINLTMTLTGLAPWEVTYSAAGNQVTETFTDSPQIIVATDPGSYYIVSVTSPNGCTGTVTGNINIQEYDVEINLNATDPPCFGVNNGVITSSASGGTAPYSYSWNTGASSQNLSGLAPGSYAVTVTDNNGCTEESSVDITGPPQLTANVVSSLNIDCYNPQGEADLEVDGGTPGYDFNWSNGSSSEDPIFTNGGTYTVTVTDDNNCTVTASVSITSNTTLPTAFIAPPAQITCANPELFLNATGSSTGPEFEYQWDGPGFLCCETTLQPQINEGGTYTLTVTNTENGCTRVVSVTVVQNDDIPTAVITPSSDIGCNSPIVTLSGAGTSTGPGITFSWSTNDGNFTCCTNTLNPQINQAGTYTLLVTNNLTGCTAEESVTVNGNTVLPQAVIVPPGVVNCYNPELTIDGSGSSQGSNISYQWGTTNGSIIGGGDTDSPTIDAGGVYTLTVTDTDNNCTATATVTVPQNLTPPNAVANGNQDVDCAHPNVSLSGTGSSTGANMTYQWTTNGGNIVSGDNTLNPVVNAGGTYILLVTNVDNGCTDEAQVTIDEDLVAPDAEAGPDMVSNCYDATPTLQGDGSFGPGINYQWTANPGNIISGGNTLNPTVNQPGFYILVVTNINNGCTSEDYVEVTANFDTPDASIAPPPVITCYDPEIVIDGSGSTQGSDIIFQWSTVNGNILSGDDSDSPIVDDPGTYTLTVTNTESGCTDQAQVVVTQNITPPVANAGNGGQISCQNPTFTLNGAGSSSGPNFTYLWETFNGNILNGETTLNPEVDQAGTYVLVVTNLVNGCTKTDDVVVTADQNFPNADAGADLELNCNNMVIEIDGTGSSSGGPIQYQWIANPGNIVSGGNTLTPEVNEEGIYTLILTNPSNGCTATDEVYVANNIIYPQAQIEPPQQLNCTFTSVMLDAGNSTQDGNISFEWNTSNGNILFGEYTPYPEVDETGVYTLVVTNEDNFCTATATITVTQNTTLPTAVAAANGVLTCQFPQVELTGQGSSSGPEFFYLWTTTDGNILSGELGLSPIVNQPGAYLLTVFNNDNGCENQATIVVTTNQAFPVSNAGPAQNITCTAQQLTLNGGGSSQGNEYAYVWATQNGNIVSGGNTLTPIVNQPGTYDLSVINTQTGCTSTSSVQIGADMIAPQSVTAPGGILSCTVTSLVLDGSGSTTGNGFVYNWTTTNGSILSGGNTLNPIINAVGDYTLVVTNQINGCTAASSTNVAADASLPVASAGPSDTLNCTVQQITLNGNASSQGAQYEYLWTGPGILSGNQTLSPLVNQPGDYNLVVTNTGNGCTALSTVAIPQDILVPTAEAGPNNVLNCTFTQLSLDGSASSSGAVFVYQWTATNGGNIVSGGNTLNPLINQPGTYQLAILNQTNGCTASDQVIVAQDVVAPIGDAGAPGLITCTNPTVTIAGTGSTGSQFSYFWTTPDGNIASGANTLNPVVDAPGTYNLLITNTVNGCTATDNVLVNKDANVPTAIALVQGELNCVVPQLQLDGLGSSQGPNFTYTWTSSNGNIVSGQNTLTPLVDAPGQYTLSILNTVNNCVALSTVNVALNLVPPTANAGTPAVISCLYPVLTLDGSGSSTGMQFTYDWNTPNGNILTGENTLAPTVDQSGFYSILVTDQQNGCTAEATVQILLDQNTPEADAGPDQTLNCYNSTLQLIGTGSSIGPNFEYQWTATNGGNILIGANTLTPTVNEPGLYTLIVTNPSNGCSATEAVTIDKDVILPVASAGNGPVLNCALTETPLDGSASSNGSNFTYLWTTANGHFVSGNNTLAPVIDEPGSYNLLVTNVENGCTATASVTVDENVVYPVVDAGASAQLNCTIQNISLNGSVSNTANYDILWTTGTGNIVSGQNALNPVVNAPGLYVISVTNQDNFCAKTDQVLITQNTIPPDAVTLQPATLTCAVPEIQLSGTGSSIGTIYNYLWTTTDGQIVSDETTLTPTVNEPGVYVLLVTNAQNTCTSTATVTVPQNIVLPLAEAGNTVTLTCTQTSLQLNGAGSSTGTQFQYLWSTSNGQISGGSASLTPTITSPGQYTIQVTDQINGCTQTDNVQVLADVNAPLSAAATPGELTCTQTNLTLSGAGSSTGTPFSYQWNTANGQILSGGTTLAPVVNEPGTYTILVTNSTNGCTTTASVAVTENITLPAANAGADALITCAITQLNLNGSGSGGVNGISYAWSASNGGNIISGANTTSPLVNAGGQYTLTITDLYNGCTQTDLAIVNLDVAAPIAAVAPPGLLTCVVPSVQINGLGSSQGPQFTYNWTGPGILSCANTLTPVVDAPGAYTLSIVNTSNGCTTLTVSNVSEDVQLPTAEAGPGFELTCSISEDNLNAAGSSAGPAFSYTWTTTNGNIVAGANTLTPVVDSVGTYTLLVTNTQTGCTSTDVVSVTRNTNYPSDIELYTEPPLCGDQRGTIRFDEVSGGVGPYLYSIDGGDNFLTLNEFGSITPGTYELLIQDINGCEYGESISFPVPVEPDVTADPLLNLEFGQSGTLTATLNIPLSQVDTIIWEPMESLTLTNKPNVVIARPFRTTEYTVTIINKDGCEDREQILVRVSDPQIWAPNAISPNTQDGDNDQFLIFSKENTVKAINKLQIYDRWGNQVFQAANIQPNDPALGWDGTFRGKPMNPAVFVWWAEVLLENDQVILMKGDVTIVR